MKKEITLIDKYIAGKVAYSLWRSRDALFVFEKNKLYEKLESLSKEPALNIGTKWFETGLTKIKYYEFMKNAISKLFYAQALMLIGVFAALIALSTQGSDRISLLGFATILLVISGSWALIEQISSFKKENEFISRLEELKWRVENDKVQM